MRCVLLRASDISDQNTMLDLFKSMKVPTWILYCGYAQEKNTYRYIKMKVLFMSMNIDVVYGFKKASSHSGRREMADRFMSLILSQRKVAWP